MGAFGKIAAAATACAMGFAASTAAQAATFVTFSGTSGVYGHSNNLSPTIADTFVVPTGKGWLSATISTVGTGISNIDFTSVTLNGTAFTTVSTGISEFRNIVRHRVDAGNQIIQVNGVSGGDGSYDGALSFTAVPEPATWALMILGLGSIGYMMRRRSAPRVTFA